MSVGKFKRTIRLILVENLYENPYFFVHEACFTHKAAEYGNSHFEKKMLVINKESLIK